MLQWLFRARSRINLQRKIDEISRTLRLIHDGRPMIFDKILPKQVSYFVKKTHHKIENSVTTLAVLIIIPGSSFFSSARLRSASPQARHVTKCMEGGAISVHVSHVVVGSESYRGCSFHIVH
jgi:hypothetical protein